MFKCPGASMPIRTLLGPMRITVILTSLPIRIRSPGFLDKTSMASLLFWAVLVCSRSFCSNDHAHRQSDSSRWAAHQQAHSCAHCDDVIAKSTVQGARKIEMTTKSRTTLAAGGSVGSGLNPGLSV